MHKNTVMDLPETAQGLENGLVKAPVAARYALVTPVRDEELYIGDMIRSISQQTVRPVRWIIVDDGSRDRTAAIVNEHAQRLDFLTLIQLQARNRRLAGGEGAVPQALRQLTLRDFDFLARFDADLLLPADYIEKMLTRFHDNTRLGIAGGTLYVEKSGRLVPEKVPDIHVRGALKMYRRQCFEDIGGLTKQIGWDTLDEATAWSCGWETKSFSDIAVIHRRPTGQGIAPSCIYRERGRAEYLTWSHPLFVIAKSIKTGLSEVSLLKPACYLAGFISSYLRHEPRIRNPRIARARRRQQKDFVLKRIGLAGMLAGRTASPQGKKDGTKLWR